MTKEELRRSAQEAGYFIEGDNGGRTTHATLANITRSKRLTHTVDGKFMVSPNMEPAFLE